MGAKIEAAILRGDFSPGAKLPTEAELGTQFGISRTVVREALQQLRSKGLVEGVRGSGSYVRGYSFARLETDLLRFTHLNSSSETVREFLDLRLLVEPECARRLALRAEADLQDTRAALSEMRRKAIPLADFAAADVEFHQSIARASGHRLFAALIACLKPTTARYGELTYENRDTLQRTLAHHEEIFRHLQARRSEAAAAAMRRHLDYSRQHFEELLQQMPEPSALPSP